LISARAAGLDPHPTSSLLPLPIAGEFLHSGSDVGFDCGNADLARDGEGLPVEVRGSSSRSSASQT
jgi:hypothetical protein